MRGIRKTLKSIYKFRRALLSMRGVVRCALFAALLDLWRDDSLKTVSRVTRRPHSWCGGVGVRERASVLNFVPKKRSIVKCSSKYVLVPPFVWFRLACFHFNAVLVRSEKKLLYLEYIVNRFYGNRWKLKKKITLNFFLKDPIY